MLLLILCHSVNGVSVLLAHLIQKAVVTGLVVDVSDVAIHLMTLGYSFQ